MIKILLETAWKEILIIIGLSTLFFIISSGISISFKPFHISFNNPYFGIGITLITIGFLFCMASAYNSGYSSGLNRSDYYKGYKKGVNDCIQRVVDLSKKQEVKEDKND